MRAQFWSFDVVFAMIIFGSALVLLTFVWMEISGQFSLSYGLGSQTIQLQLQSLQRRILLPGNPSSWYSQINTTNTLTWNNISIGLGTGTGSQLSPGKIATFASIGNYNSVSYQATKPLLGIGYDYFIIINSTNYTMTIGKSPFAYNPYAMQVARQSATLNGAPVRIQIILWTNKSVGVG